MKRLLNLITASVMVLSTLAVNAGAVDYGEELINQPTKTYTQKFSDVPSSHWAFSYIGEMAERGVIDGYMDNTFKPENNVTRAEFAKIMVAASGLPITKPISKDFYDVEVDSWYAPYIHAAYPYLNGYTISGQNYYTPDTPALREDIAVALVKLKGYSTDGADESVLTSMFTDMSSISSDARKYVSVAVTRGLVSGYDDNTFRGQASITRAEATAMLWRAFQYGNDNKTFDTTQNTQASVTETPTVSPVPTAAPNTIVTQKPTTTPSSANTNTGTVKRLPEPIPSPTPTPRPYVVDTVAKASISNTITMMTTDCDNIYYYDNGKNGIYKLDMTTDDVSEVVNLSDVTVGDNSSANQYSDFEIDKLYYDGKLVMKGSFKKVIHNANDNSDDDDDSGSNDNETTEAPESAEEDVDYPMYIDVLTLEELGGNSGYETEYEYNASNTHTKALIVNGWGKYKINRGFQRADFTAPYGNWHNDYSEYIERTKQWVNMTQLYHSELWGNYCSVYNGAVYTWNIGNWTDVNAKYEVNRLKTLDDKNIVLSFSKGNIDNSFLLVDYAADYSDPKNDERKNLKQFFLKDETKMYFYDEDSSSIRMLKRR